MFAGIFLYGSRINLSIFLKTNGLNRDLKRFQNLGLAKAMRCIVTSGLKWTNNHGRETASKGFKSSYVDDAIPLTWVADAQLLL